MAARARYTRTSSSKWNDPWYLSLHVHVRNLFDFLHECGENTIAGIYQGDLAVARLKTGNPRWRQSAFEAALLELQGHVTIYPDNWLWVVNYLKWNVFDFQDSLSRPQAGGIVAIVRVAPVRLQADFWRRYGPKLAEAGYPWDTLGNGLSDPSESPPLPSPTPPSGGLLPPVGVLESTARARARKQRKLTDDQVAAMQAAIDHYYQRLQQHTQAVAPRFKGGPLAQLFTERLTIKAPKRPDSSEDLIAYVDIYFDDYLRPHASANTSHFLNVFNDLLTRRLEQLDA